MTEVTSDSEWLKKYQQKRDEKRDVFKSKLPLWCKFFKENGITQVFCEYEGSGDSGCIDNVYFFEEYNEDRSQLWVTHTEDR